MTLAPIIEAKLEEFQRDYYIAGSQDDVYEKYVNYHIMKQLYPETLSTDADALENMSVGGNGDLGIDGLIVSINDHPVSTIEEAKSIISTSRKIAITLVFIQSKNKKGFNHDDYSVFMAGIEDFLRERINMPANDHIRELHEIYEYLNSNEIMLLWKDNPSIEVFYVTNGVWEEQDYILADSKSFSEHIAEKNLFKEPMLHYVDGKRLLDIINSNENTYETVIDVVDSMDLPIGGDVNKSSVFLCTGQSLIEMITTETGLLRKNIFEDNVRDFQGYTDINLEMKKTVEETPEQFLLLNNGITVVCEDFNYANRKLKIVSPQIVNGCQTCNILFENSKQKDSLENISVIVKIIASNNTDTVNNIVKGTNRQNIVYEEAFETTKEFHKLLEKFFVTMQMVNYPMLYYERRAKQYSRNPSIKPNQKVNMRMIASAIVSIFLNKPDKGSLHESIILKEFKDKIFNDNQSFYPYYTAAFIYKQLDTLFREKRLPTDLRAYILHIACILRESIGPDMPGLNSNRKIEKYCKEMFEKISDPNSFLDCAKNACEEFRKISAKWTKEKGRSYMHGIKDNSEFTNFMREYLEGKQQEVSAQGRICHIGLDIHGKMYGFIERTPGNIFFHEANNPHINLNLAGKYVSYRLIYDEQGRETAKDIEKVYEKENDKENARR